jgi:TonB family protein
VSQHRFEDSGALRFTPPAPAIPPEKRLSHLGSGTRGVEFAEAGAGRARWELIGASSGAQALLVFALLWIPALTARYAPPRLVYDMMPLTPRPLSDYTPSKPAEVPAKMLRVAPAAEPVAPPKLAALRLLAAVPRTPKASPPAAEPPMAEPAPLAATQFKGELPAPRRPVEIGSFESTGGTAAAKLGTRAASQVQTGGFGDPQGVPETGPPRATPNINRLGSFDLLSGPGMGNGTGGATGARGPVASAGFGNGIAAPGGSARSERRAVQPTHFGDAAPSANAEPRTRPAPRSDTRVPVEIIAKPRPEYTEEARLKRIEGDVRLRVLFAASGEIRVLGLMQGLGYGLDQSAVAAAQRIRFKPARVGASQVDQEAVITIEFRLAY